MCNLSLFLYPVKKLTVVLARSFGGIAIKIQALEKATPYRFPCPAG